MDSIDQLSDKQIIERYKVERDTAYVGQLYHRYAHLIFGWCLRYLKNQTESEDAVMEIIEQLLQNLHKYEIKDFKNWLFLVTRNHCFARLRKKTEHLIDDISNLGEDQFMENEEIAPLTIEAREKALHDEIENLKGPQKECIVLFYFKKKTYKEISEITRYDINKVKSHIQNGKRNLRIGLDKDGFSNLIEN